MDVMLHAPAKESKLRCGGYRKRKRKRKQELEKNASHNDSDEKRESEMVRRNIDKK